MIGPAWLLCSVCGDVLAFMGAQPTVGSVERLWLRCVACGMDHVMPPTIEREERGAGHV